MGSLFPTEQGIALSGISVLKTDYREYHIRWGKLHDQRSRLNGKAGDLMVPGVGVEPLGRIDSA